MTRIIVIESAMLSGWSFLPSSRDYELSVMTTPRSSDPSSWESLKNTEKVDALIVDSRIDSSALSFTLAAMERHEPKIVVILGEPDLSVEPAPSMQLVGAKTYLPNWRMNIAAELYGSPFIQTFGLRCWADGTLGVQAPAPMFGPTVKNDDDEPVLWPDMFSGRGAAVSRDSGDVLRYLYLASSGQAPLWARAGWPVLLPETPYHFRDFDFEGHGVLCASSSQAGGFVVLKASDLLEIAGIPVSTLPQLPPNVLWNEVRRAITVPFALTLCGWLNQQISRLRERAPS